MWVYWCVCVCAYCACVRVCMCVKACQWKTKPLVVPRDSLGSLGGPWRSQGSLGRPTDLDPQGPLGNRMKSTQGIPWRSSSDHQESPVDSPRMPCTSPGDPQEVPRGFQRTPGNPTEIPGWLTKTFWSCHCILAFQNADPSTFQIIWPP